MEQRRLSTKAAVATASAPLAVLVDQRLDAGDPDRRRGPVASRPGIEVGWNRGDYEPARLG
jgi:hypothetical protein